jgi:uncharacterized protein
MIDGMLTVDAHCHIGESPVERNGIKRFSADDLIERMDRNGIDQAVVMHLIFPVWERDEVQRANDYVLGAIHRYPDRLTGLCIVNPKHGDFAVREAERGLAAGLRGLKVQPVMHGYWPIDGVLMDPVMRVASDRGVPLITHSDFNAKCCTPYQVVRLAKRWPRVTVVLLHLGQDPESVTHTPDIVKDTPNIVVETSNTPDYPYPVFVNPARVLGADRVMFGSDGPVLSVEVNLTKLAVAEQVFGLTAEEKRWILGGTAKRVFGLG